MHIIQGFKSGPLDIYRKKSSFDWKKLKVFLNTEEVILFENEVIDILKKIPIFNIENVTSKSLDEQRKISFERATIISNLDILSFNRTLTNLKLPSAACRILTVLDAGSYIKHTVGNTLFSASVKNMGTERHLKYVCDAEDSKIFGCYCLTEIGHGSNARGMRTTATYNKEKKSFILNSPDFEAAKCWAGGLGQTAMYGTIYAQLLLNGQNYGLHGFVVPLRDTNTLLPYPGVEIGDMGGKIGLDGVDNGFVRFINYEIPRVNLLNKVADVTEDGQYVSTIKDPNKRHGAALGSLSAGRVNISCMSESLGIKALTIAIRYAAVRRQFGPNDKEEIPILEYQSHQNRLIPYLAAAYVLRNFDTYISEVFFQFSLDSILGNVRPDAPEMGIEIHGVSSASKPMAGWIMKEAIQESRECCGGHGYLKASGLGDVRNEHDPNLTYEGENHILIQQTINWLLKFWPQILENKKISSPLQSTDFLTYGQNILKNSRFIARGNDEMCHPESIINAYQWLVVYLLKSTHEKVEGLVKSGKSIFSAKNDSQVYYGKNLAIAFIQHFFLQRMLATINQSDDPAIKSVLTKLFSLYGLWSIDKYHVGTLYKGGYVTNNLPPQIIQDSILKLCSDLKDDAVSLIDVIAPHDFLMDSVLGASDGQVYKRLQDSMYNNEYCMNRPPWWKDIVKFTQNKSKL